MTDFTPRRDVHAVSHINVVVDRVVNGILG
jgi:hypothetical protein